VYNTYFGLNRNRQKLEITVGTLGFWPFDLENKDGDFAYIMDVDTM
jgi:hypothetical protein